MPAVKSCFKLNEYKRWFMLKISRKKFWYLDQNNLHAFVRHWASPSYIFSHLLQNLMLKCLHFFPLPDYCLMISGSIGTAGALFQCLGFPCVHGCPHGGFPCVHGCPHGGQNGNLPPPGNWDKEPKNSRKLKSAA